jgi:hypothetical protein
MADQPLQRAATRLKVVHRQRVNRGGDAEPEPAFVAAAVAPEILGAAAGGWQRLVETEYESIVIAGWMTSALARLGAPLDLVGAFGRVVEDEIRHVDLCAEMVETLGGRPVVPRGALPPFPAAQLVGPGASPAAAAEAEFEILAGVVGFFCVFEQLSGLIFREAVEVAEEPRAKWALAEIFRDEAFHGAFGFEAAAWFVPRWDEARRVRLAERAVADIGRFEARLRGGGGGDPGSLAALERVGMLSTARLLGTFTEGVHEELLPRLRAIGIPIELARPPGLSSSP